MNECQVRPPPDSLCQVPYDSADDNYIRYVFIPEVNFPSYCSALRSQATVTELVMFCFCDHSIAKRKSNCKTVVHCWKTKLQLMHIDCPKVSNNVNLSVSVASSYNSYAGCGRKNKRRSIGEVQGRACQTTTSLQQSVREKRLRTNANIIRRHICVRRTHHRTLNEFYEELPSPAFTCPMQVKQSIAFSTFKHCQYKKYTSCIVNVLFSCTMYIESILWAGWLYFIDPQKSENWRIPKGLNRKRTDPQRFRPKTGRFAKIYSENGQIHIGLDRKFADPQRFKTKTGQIRSDFCRKRTDPQSLRPNTDRSAKV